MQESWRGRQLKAYREFSKMGKASFMDRRNIVIAFLPTTNYPINKIAREVSETLHLPLFNRLMVPTIEELKTQLFENPPHGYIFEALPKDADELSILEQWSQGVGMNIHLFRFQDENKLLIERVKDKQGLNVHSLNLGESTNNLFREVFNHISPICFEDPNLASDYYHFIDLCQRLGIKHMLVSGACSYIYWGRCPLKDLDILVPSLDDLEKLASIINQSTEHLVSSFAVTNYLNFSSSVEVISDLEILYDDDIGQRRIPFTFSELSKDSQQVRFLGEESNLMSPEMLVLFKFSMGRFGIDQWGKHKDDYEDARGVIISQGIDLEKLKNRAKKLGVLERVLLGVKILNLE